jgi:hypothetical protein
MGDMRLRYVLEFGQRCGLSVPHGAPSIEMIDFGEPRTPFLRGGERIRLETLDEAGHSIFGATDQRYVIGNHILTSDLPSALRSQLLTTCTVRHVRKTCSP